jgi:hypothetical protein
VKSIEQDYMLTLKPDLSILKGNQDSAVEAVPAEITIHGITVLAAHMMVRYGKRLWIIDTGNFDPY